MEKGTRKGTAAKAAWKVRSSHFLGLLTLAFVASVLGFWLVFINAPKPAGWQGQSGGSNLAPNTVSINPNLHATPLVQQWDAGVTHTYRLNESITPMNVSVGDAIYATPTVYGGTMFVSTMGNLTQLNNSRYDLTKGSVAAINMSTGRIIWRTWVPNQVMTQPIIAGNLLVVGMSNDGEVPRQYYNNLNGMYALNISTGRIVWNIKSDSIPTGSDMATPVYYKGLILEPGEGAAEIYNASTGALVRKIVTNLPTTIGSPLLVNNVAYFSGGYGTAYGYNSFTENISGVKMHITSDDRIFAINMSPGNAGNVIWQTRFFNAGEGSETAKAAYADGIVVTEYLYQSDYGNPWVVGLNSTTGNVLWQSNETRFIREHNTTTPRNLSIHTLGYTLDTVSPVTIWNGTAYVNSNFMGTLVAVNISTGKILWATPTGQDETNPNVFYGHYLLTLNDAGYLFVIDARNGSVINVTFINMPHLGNEPIITDNYAILAGMNGRIITIPLNSLVIKHTEI